VIENWNSTNDFILYGKGSEISSNRLQNQELTVLSMHLLLASLVYINYYDSICVSSTRMVSTNDRA
jgi:TnpA family transposase